MPPQGESTGLALEDAVIFARLLGLHLGQSSKSSNQDEEATDFKRVFSSYLSHRFARIDEAYNEANMRWEQVKDSGWLVQKVKEWLTWVFMWWMSRTKAKYFEEDWGSVELTL
jgi:salicylate hydroxylase